MAMSTPPARPSGLIGPYRVAAVLGTGGMGRVLKVEDTRTGVYRALKIHFEPTREQSIFLNYRREHRAMARLNHPNVIQVFDYGIFESRPYFVMEYVPGVPLTDFLESRDLQPGPERDRMAALLGIQIASALDHLHGHNLIHRDLKPDNILVTPDERVKLIDFGIAQEIRPDFVNDNQLAGTYAYSAPEQFAGVPLDHRADLYSFGIVLYLLVTGHLPFVARHNLGYVLKHAVDPPEPLETHYPGIPSQLRDIILKLLEKKPIDRQQDSREVERALRRFVERRDQGRSRLSSLGLDEAGVQLARGERQLYEPAFVGREQELELIEGSITMMQAGAGGVLLVVGESGMGKARLVDEALAGARARGIAVFSGQCVPDAELPYQGILELVQAMVASVAGRGRDLIEVMLGPHLPVLARAFPSVAELLPPGSAPSPDGDAVLDHDRIRLALTAFLEAVPAGPTVLVLKNVHWADAATRSLIAAVCTAPRNALAAPILWLGTVATDQMTAENALQSWLQKPPPMVQIIPVPPLEVGEVETLVRSMLGTNLELKTLAADLHRESNGNPMSVAQTLRGLVDRGSLLPRRDEPEEATVWSLRPGSDGERVETLVQPILETLAERIDLLSSNASAVLEPMAVLGRPCSFELLQRLTGISEDPLLDVLDDALARRILIERNGQKHSLFSFSHPKMASVVLDRMPPERRQQLHRDVADAWLKVHGEHDPAAVAFAGTHLFQGRAYVRALPFLLTAAEERHKLGLFDAALVLLEQALECFRAQPDLDRRTFVLVHLQVGEAYKRLEELDKAAQHLQIAVREAEHHQLAELESRVLMSMAQLAALQGDHASSYQSYVAAMKLQRICQDQTGLLTSVNGAASSLLCLGNASLAKKLLGEAAAGARKMEHAPLMAQALYGLGQVATHEGRFGEAAGHFQAAAEQARASGRGALTLMSRVREAEARRQQGELGVAQTLVGGALAELERLGGRDHIVDGLCIRAAVALEVRALDLVEQLLVRVAEQLAGSLGGYAHVMHQLLTAQLDLVRGRMKEALATVGEALAAAETRGYEELVARAHRLLAAARIRSGAPGEGLTLARHGIAEAEHLGNAPGVAEGLLLTAEGLGVLGRKEEAQSTLESAVQRFQQLGMRLPLIRALALSGRLAIDAGREALAAQLFDTALEHARDIRNGLPPEDRVLFDKRPELVLLRNQRRVG